MIAQLGSHAVEANSPTIFRKGLRKTIGTEVSHDDIAALARLMLGGRGEAVLSPKEELMTDRPLNTAGLGPTPASNGRTIVTAQEELVADARAALRPAEMVERKLLSMLRSAPMPVSMLAGAFRKR